jgi:hypothetical protein
MISIAVGIILAAMLWKVYGLQTRIEELEETDKVFGRVLKKMAEERVYGMLKDQIRQFGDVDGYGTGGK